MASSIPLRATVLRLSFILLSLAAIPAAQQIKAQLLPSSAQYFRYVFDIPKGYINDHCLIYTQGIWHAYFIQGKLSGNSWDAQGNEVLIGHATSPDLLNWTLQKPALSVDPDCPLDSGHIYAPSVVERDGRYYMLYTGNEGTFSQGERIFMATSTDLFNWSRHACEPVLVPDSSWAAYYAKGYKGGNGGPVSGRDPCILKDPKGAGYICYYVARLKIDSSQVTPGQGIIEEERDDFACVAAATSTDLVHWVDRGPVLIRPVRADEAYPFGHPESPCVIFRDDRYYLFWKSGSGTRYAISRHPLDFRDRTEYFLSTAHAGKIFEWNGRWYITSASRDIDDIAHSRSDRTRGLFLASIRWDGRHPVVIPLDTVSLGSNGTAAPPPTEDWAK